MTTICKCGIAALDCEYHRPSPQEACIKTAKTGLAAWLPAKTLTPASQGANWSGMSDKDARQFIDSLYISNQITSDQYFEASRAQAAGQDSVSFLSVTPGEVYLTVRAVYYNLACDAPAFNTRITL